MTYKVFGKDYDTGEDIHSCNIYWDRDRNYYWCKILESGNNHPYAIPSMIKLRAVTPKVFDGNWTGKEDLSNLDSDFLEFYLSQRVIPPNRDLLKETLMAEGIYEYDWRVLIRYNNGRVIDDHNWLEFEESDENPDT